jgi:hypothetical protein
MGVARDGIEVFSRLSRRLCRKPEVAVGTMMGFPCLRADGKFFASLNREASQLIVKLPEGRVKDAVKTREGLAFAPNGRVFREWLAVPVERAEDWPGYLKEAHAFVSENES